MKHRFNGFTSSPPFKLRRLDQGSSVIGHESNAVHTLFDLSARVVAEFLPFEYVEKTLVHVPEPVQEKIIYYSFPRRDSDIYTYASFHPKADKGRDKIPYYEGLDYFQNDCVEDVIQIGFHLTGSVRQPHCVSSDSERRKFEVSITFDRCKIISVCCDCGNKGLSWCPHVVALALYRIRQPHLVDYRSPISDALVRMDRSQLQKFAQYLIASHPNKVLPSAQQLADELLQPESSINRTSGAPDPTAGASVEDVAAWYLDEAGVREQLRAELANLANNGSVSGPSSSVTGFATGSIGTNGPRSVGGRSTPLMSNSTGANIGPNAAAVTATSSFATTGANQVGPSRSASDLFHTDSLRSGSQVPNSEIGQHCEAGHSNPVHSEAGLNWLLRYRRLMSNQTLLGGPFSSACQPPESIPSLHLGITPDAAGSTHWFGPQTGPLMSSVSSSTLVYGAPTASATASSSLTGSGAQIAAMFAKVRELLAKRDSNGPRLLSLITEELLRCPKLPLLKARRTHRGAELSGRMPIPGLTRSLSAQQLLSPNSALDSGPGANLYSHTSSASSSSSSQLPAWTTRLWEEVCVLWTCVVLNPDCNAEARRQWRNRFISWVRAHRCPRDEAYAVPGHYFAHVRDQSELDDDIGGASAQQPPSTTQQQQQQQSGRPSNRRASIFQLPLEASFLSWDDEGLRCLAGLECAKKRAGTDPDASLDDMPPLTTGGAQINPTESDEVTNSAGDLFRRPASNTPTRRGPGRSHASRDCQCPYCEPTACQVNEPFPLLCLRVAALRANGYPTQALRLAVFISQRLLRAFKTKATSANNSIMSYSMRGACQSHAGTGSPWIASYSNEASVRRSLFAGTGTSARMPAMCNYGTPPTPYNGAGRYTPTTHILSSSTISNHPKYHSSSRLPSPRPASISPPVSAGLPRSVTRRHVMSPGPNTAPLVTLCSGPTNWTNHNTSSGLSASVYKATPHPVPPPSPFNTHSPSFSHMMMHGYSSAASPSVPPPPPPPFHPHYAHNYHHHHHQPQQHFAQSAPSPYAFGQANPYGSATSYPSPVTGRQLASPKLLGRPALFPTGVHRLPNPSHNGNASNSPYPSGSFSTGGGDLLTDSIHAQPAACSSLCPSHTDSAWIGLPGRPVICLVECLLDAAAMVVESGHRRHPSEVALWGQLEPASFYLCLAVKICLIALFQQRRLSGSINRLLFSQTQESRLLAWLSTMPRDTVTVLAMCETLAHLLGPPVLSRLMPRSEPGLCLNPSATSTSPAIPSPAWWWWWSALGPVIHPDSYPVHGVAHLVLNYVLEAQAQNPVHLIHNFWAPSNSASLTASSPSFSSSGSGSSGSCHGSSTAPVSAIRMDDLLFAVVTRAMRFSVLEPVSDSTGFMSANMRPNHLHAHQTPYPPPPVYNPSNYYPYSGAPSSFAARPTDRSLYTSRYWDADHVADLESALAVNTEIGELNQDPTVFVSNRTSTPESHSHPPQVPSTQPGFHYSVGQSSQSRVIDADRWPITPTVHYPPLPSAFASAVQACIKLLDIPYTQSGSYMPIPPVLSSPCFSPACMATRTSLSPIAHMCDASLSQTHHQLPLQQQQQQPQQTTLNTIFSHSNTPVRRCLEGMELQQTHLAVALIRLSKSTVQRLDQVVQICDRHIHSAVNLLTISQQIFAEAVGLEPVLAGVRKYDPLPLFNPSLLNTFAHDVCQLGSSGAPQSSTSSITAGAYSPDRINLICTAYHLALLVVLRTLTPRTVHWRRREMLAWAVSTALHVGPSACLYLVTNWSTYVSPREAVNWLAPALIAVIAKSESGGLSNLVGPPCETKSSSTGSGKSVPLVGSQQLHATAELIEHDTSPSSCAAAASLLLFGPTPADGSSTLDHHQQHAQLIADELHSTAAMINTAQHVAASGATSWPSWYGFQPPGFTSRHHTNSITVAAQMLGSAVPYSISAREHILAAVRHMALQAAAKDPANCALPALTLAERNAAAFDAVYRLVLHSAESGGLGVLRLFSLARYMDSRGWAWRAFPFALHATRLFVLSTMQDGHPVANDVLWACSLAHRLGPGALQEILTHVIRNIHCPTLLTEILHRCRVAPAGLGCTVSILPNQNNPVGSTLQSDGNGSNQLAVGRNSCPASFNSTTLYHPLTNSANASTGVHSTLPPLPMGHAKLLSLDRPPLKALLDATINAFVTATHTRLANISPRQYAEFVDFLARARDTFHLLRPDGPSQFRSLVECLRQTYRGKRKLVSLLSERFG